MPRRISAIVELPASSQTQTLSAAWAIRTAQIAKTLPSSAGRRAVLAIVGGKAAMLREAATITGRVLGGVPVRRDYAHADVP